MTTKGAGLKADESAAPPQLYLIYTSHRSQGSFSTAAGSCFKNKELNKKTKLKE